MARAERQRGERLGLRRRWAVGIAVAVLVGGGAIWLLASEPEWYRFLLRLYQDKVLLRDFLRRWGILGPLIFMAIQALQVVISPIPGDVTGFLGGFVFGQWLGFGYSTVGLTVGSLLAFWVGRQLGAPFVKRVTGEGAWDRLGFIVDAGGAILCFVIFLLPGVPKDIACYLFGMSPMPFWVFAVLSTAGRMPGTWVLSAQGAKTAEGQYIQLLVLSSIVAAVTLPLYYYRHQIVARLGRRRRLTPGPDRPSERPGQGSRMSGPGRVRGA